MSNFLLIYGNDGRESILNLDQIRMVTNISNEGLRVYFSETHSIDFTGSVVNDLLTLFGKLCIVSDGSPLTEFQEKMRLKKSRRPEPDLGPTPKA